MEWAQDHKTLIILGVRDQGALIQWERRLRDARIICESFREPDIEGEKTAIAVCPTADPQLFRNLRLI